MALAPITERPVTGVFTHRETGAVFEFTPASLLYVGSLFDREINESLAGKPNRLPNVEIFMSDGSTRFVRLRKTVAWVCVDQDEEGHAVWERWPIKQLQHYV